MPNATNDFVERLFVENSGELGTFLRRRLPRPAELEDAVQEVYLRLCRVENPERIHNPRAFLFRTATNVIVDYIRKKRVYDRFFIGGQINQEEVSSGAPSAEDALQSKRWLQAYVDALNELTPKCRLVFVMCRTHGKKHSEIAAELNVSTKMVEKYMTQALAHLSQRLESFFEPRQ